MLNYVREKWIEEVKGWMKYYKMNDSKKAIQAMIASRKRAIPKLKKEIIKKQEEIDSLNELLAEAPDIKIITE